MLPWVHLYVSPHGAVNPCCLTPWDPDKVFGSINEQPVLETWNGAQMRSLRKRMLKDKKNEICTQCYRNEDLGQTSKRQLANLLYKDKIQWVNETDRSGRSSKAKPIYWDIRISNLCNFKCRICGHHSSSKWFEDAKALGSLSHEGRVNYSMKDMDDVLKQLEFVIPELEEVYFAGGEPLIMEEHYQILDLLIGLGKTDIRLRYNTNFSMTTFKDRDVFELWKYFDDVQVHASLDDMGPRAEFQRKGQNWTQVLLERKRMLEFCPHVELTVGPTISVFNVFSITDFHRNWVESHLIDVDDFIPHTLHHPAAYSIRILPEEMKAEVREKFAAHLEWLAQFRTKAGMKFDMVVNEFERSVTYMDAEDWSDRIPEFRKMCGELDELRNENTLDMHPELEGLFGVRP